MSFARWLNRVTNPLRASKRPRRRYLSPLSWDWLLEDRTLMTGPPFAMPGNNNAPNGVTSVFWNGGPWPANPSNSTPTPPAKLITIQNNTQQIIYPVLRDANSQPQYNPADFADREYRIYIGFQVGSNTYLGLPPGAQITIQVPLVFWNAENTYYVSDGENLVPASPTAPNPYVYDPASTRYTTASGPWVSSFSTPLGNPLNATGGAVMFYQAATPATFNQGGLAQLAEYTIRDPYLGQYFGVTGGDGTQDIFDYDVSYVNDALMPIAQEALQSTIPPPPSTALGSADYGISGATLNFVNNPSDPLNDPSMQAWITAFMNNDTSLLPNGGLGSYFPNSQGWPAYYNPNPVGSPDGTKIPSGANIFANSPLLNQRSAYDQNEWALNSAGVGPVVAGSGSVAAGNSNPYGLSFGSMAERDSFVSILQGWINDSTPLTVTDAGTNQVVATKVLSVTAVGSTGAQVTLNTTPTTGNATWVFARTATDYASQQIASIWYAWAYYYLNTVLAGFKGATYPGSFIPSPAPGAKPAYLLLNSTPTNLNLGMVVSATVGGQQAFPTGTTVVYIDPNNPRIIYLSKNPTLAVNNVQITFSKPTALPFSNDPLLYQNLVTSLKNFQNTAFANAFASVVYEVLAFEFQSSLGTPTDAVQLVGKAIGGDVAPANFLGTDPYTLEHILRDRIKSILRGVPDFTQPQWSNENTWYPAPADNSGGGGQSFNVYNLDPFVWFIHDALQFSGYGFSLDDDTGNVQAFTSQLFVTIGSPAGMPTKTEWSNQVQYGQQIAMTQILPPSKFVAPQFQGFDLLFVEDPITYNQINADSDLGPGAAVTGPGIPIDPANPVRVIGKTVISSSGQEVLVLNTKAAKPTPKGQYVRLIYTSKSRNASSVVNQNFAAVNNSPNLGPNWQDVGNGGLKIVNHQAVGISAPSSFIPDQAEYVGPTFFLTDTAVAAVASVSNSVSNSYAGVFARRDSNNDFYALLLVHDPNLNASANFIELARFTPGLAGTAGGWTFVQVLPLPSGFTNATSVELQLQVIGVGLHTSLQAYVKDPATNKTILATGWTEGEPIYQFPSPFNGGVRSNPLSNAGTAGLITFFAGGAFTNFTVFALKPTTPTLQLANTANASFVQGVYQSLLNRSIDGGAEFWIGQLGAGASPAAVVEGVERSTEYLDDLVNNLYEQYLQRPADAGGLNHWVGLLQSGETIEQVISGLVSSPEYFALRGGTNSAFVASLYTKVLGRSGSAAEINGWVSAMAHGTTAAQVANAFLSSQEYRTDLVESYYQTYLDRAATPLELVQGFSQLSQGVPDQVLVASIIGSAEGFGDFSQSLVPPDFDPATNYVGSLYQTLLGRTADSGAQSWVNLLHAGASPVTVVQSIEAGTEYLQDLVSNLYLQCLQRFADPSGLNFFVGKLQSGGTIEQVISALVSSPEYYALQGGTNSAFVASLYTNILGRTGSSTEINGWVSAMAGGMTASQVANAFLSSQEYRTNLVESYYQTYLGRDADAGGLASFLNQLNQGVHDQAVLASILGSAERSEFTRHSAP